MLQVILSRIGWFVALVLLQVYVFNHIHLLGYATPMPYVYFLLILPGTTPRALYLVLGFALGLVLDVFGNTPGLTAASLTAVALATPPLLTLFGPSDRTDDALLPSAQTMEWSGFLKYAACLVVLHCLVFFALEAFTLALWPGMLLSAGSSAALTLLFVVAFEWLRQRRS